VKIESIMVKPVITATEEATLEDAARTMLEHNIGCLPIINEREELCGIVTESDFTGKERALPFSPLSLYGHPQVLGAWLPKQGVEQIYQAARTKKVREIMTSCVVTTTEDQTVEEVVRLLVTRNLHRIPVVRDNKPVGILTRRDLLRLMISKH
jgi:CBS domain-containing protein